MTYVLGFISGVLASVGGLIWFVNHDGVAIAESWHVKVQRLRIDQLEKEVTQLRAELEQLRPPVKEGK